MPKPPAKPPVDRAAMTEAVARARKSLDALIKSGTFDHHKSKSSLAKALTRYSLSLVWKNYELLTRKPVKKAKG